MNSEIMQWAIRHGVSMQAIHELQALFGMHGDGHMPTRVTGTSEEAVASVLRLEAARKGVRLWRNNVGALLDQSGRPVRYGLANESSKLNEKLKSADYIGWRSVLIGPQHVGSLFALFTSRETKEVGWHYTGTDREKAQLAWAQLVTAGGGDASFCTGEGTL